MPKVEYIPYSFIQFVFRYYISFDGSGTIDGFYTYFIIQRF